MTDPQPFDPHAPLAVRPSREADLPAIQAIYARHVVNGTATFEEIPPSIDEMAARRGALLAKNLPYLAACAGDAVVGYAYAGLYRARSAYRFTLEDSVYVDARCLGRGAGRLLVTALVEAAAALGYRQMIAVIGDSANLASITLHERSGFVRTGVLRNVGFKHGRFLDTVFMQRPLGLGDAVPPVEIARG